MMAQCVISSGQTQKVIFSVKHLLATPADLQMSQSSSRIVIWGYRVQINCHKFLVNQNVFIGYTSLNYQNNDVNSIL